jgi:hypothetical protein
MKPVITSLLLFISVCSYAQINYTGHYGYIESEKDFLRRHPKAPKDEMGYKNNLVLLRLKNNEYKFWLYVIKGYPGYNSGEIEGIIRIANDSAVYFKKDTLVGFECNVVFHFYSEKVFINHVDGNCGFGAGVTADGEYPKISSTIPTMKDVADNYQIEVPEYKVVSDKAIIYKSADNSAPTKQYFVKGDSVYAFEQDNEFVYIQFITKAGKYIEGWLKKSDLK